MRSCVRAEDLHAKQFADRNQALLCCDLRRSGKECYCMVLTELKKWVCEIMLLTHACKFVSVPLAMKANMLPLLSLLLLLSMRERFNALQQKGSGLLLQHSCSGLGLLS